MTGSDDSQSVAQKVHAVDITVVICTRNRAAQLRQVLESAAAMQAPDQLRWELLIVDNASWDDTSDVVHAFSDRLPIRLVREEESGLSHARNRGVREARGRYICWTDDDVLIDRGWLAAYAEAFERHPEAAVFGGKIVPTLTAPTPAWFARNATRWPLNTLIADRNFGDEPLPLDFDAGIFPWGANFAVRTAEQRQTRFEPALGVSPNQKRLGEEAEAIFRMMRSGATGWWVPNARVKHLIPVRRQTLWYVFDYNVAYGETLAYADLVWPGGHHLSRNVKDLDRTSGGAARQTALAGMYLLGFVLTWPLKALSLILLARAGLHAGAARIAADGSLRQAGAATASDSLNGLNAETPRA